jgi:hypothetical protein
MRHFQLVTRKWMVNLSHSPHVVCIEVTDQVPSATFRRVIRSVYSNFRFLVLSQYVDSGQWRIGDKTKFLATLVEKHDAEVTPTATFQEATPIQESSPIFIMHIRGRPDLTLLNDAMRFGMTSLSNIVYGANQMPADWLTDLLKWNAEILSWFQQKTSIRTPELIDLIGGLGIVAMTIDGHLCFFFEQLYYLDTVLSILQQVAEERQIQLVITPSKLT